MPIFRYQGISPSGKIEKGIVDADSMPAAREKVRKMGVTLTDIFEDTPSKTKPGVGFLSSRSSKERELFVITSQMGMLIKSGFSVTRSLSAMIDGEISEQLKGVLAEVKQDIERGKSLSEALIKHKSLFSDFYINMVKAGESSGALDIVLIRLSEVLRQGIELKSKIRSAMAYPILVAIVGLLVVGFLFIHVIPSVVSIFNESQLQLPLPTLILIGISSFLKKTWFVLIIILSALIYLLKRYSKTGAGRKRLDKAKLSFRLLRAYLGNLYFSRFCRSLGMLLNSGIPLSTALEISRAVIGNMVIRDELSRIKEQVISGKSLADAMRTSKYFPSLLIHVVDIGEQGGNLGDMLLETASIFEGDLDNNLSMLTSLIEPVMILLMGLIVGFVVISVLLPLLQMSQALG